ncbi:hypothetical protein ABH13_0255 [Bacillus velezensis]|nr:hypothetical protein V529_02550 [Bacillus velezensis SQR9]AKL74865.1 hypothetical protein ABH13_0255 [Bacillus velezensis]EJD67467.1 hypothetical protein BB65665_11095 [Bacillus sp. 916]
MTDDKPKRNRGGFLPAGQGLSKQCEKCLPPSIFQPYKPFTLLHSGLTFLFYNKGDQ